MSRGALLERWRRLTQMVLPGLAETHDWPIREDHCFMRVCLDDAMGMQWDRAMRRPAVKYMTDAQLERAVATAERIAAQPGLLPELNEASLRMRGHADGGVESPLDRLSD